MKVCFVSCFGKYRIFGGLTQIPQKGDKIALFSNCDLDLEYLDTVEDVIWFPNSELLKSRGINTKEEVTVLILVK